MEYEGGETVYEFPDDMAQDEVLRILTDKGIIEPPALPAEPIPELELPAPDIPRPAELAAAREEAAQAAGVLPRPGSKIPIHMLTGNTQPFYRHSVSVQVRCWS